MIRTLKIILSQIFIINKKYFSKQRRLLKHRKNADFNTIYKNIHEEYSPIFVLSTGRSGTAFLTNIFDQYDHISVHHADFPELTYHTKVAYENSITNEFDLTMAFDAARYELIQEDYLQNLRFIETNNKITFFANEIYKLYPKAIFIHLIRHPGGFVRSAYNYNWYSGKNRHDVGRLTPLNIDKHEWSSWSRVKKMSWFWNETQIFIENFKNNASPDRVITIKLEDIVKDYNLFKELLTFLDLPAMSESKYNSLKNSKVNRSSNQKLAKYKDWNEEHLKDLREVISPQLSEMYNYKIK